MGYWVVTVAGMAILSVLCDVILPEGQTRKYVKTVFGIVVSLVIIQPIVGLFNGDFMLQFPSNSSVEMQDDYLNNVSSRMSENAKQSLTSVLNKNGIVAQSIEVNDADKKVIVELNVGYSDAKEMVVNQVAGVYFPEYDVVVIWQ